MAEVGEKLKRVFARLFLDTGLSVVAAGLSAVFGVVRAGLMTRAVGVDGFGRLALALSTFALIRQLLSVRVWEWVANLVANARARGDHGGARAGFAAGAGIGAFVHLAVFGLCVSLAGPVSRTLLGDASVVTLLRICALQALVLWMDEPSLALLRVMGRYRFIAAYNVFGSALRTAVVALVAFDAPTVEAILGVQIAAQVLLSILVFARGGFELRSSFPNARADLSTLWAARREHLRALATLSATDTVKAISGELDPSVITFFAGSAEAAGTYRASFTVVNGILQLLGPAYFVIHAEITNGVARRDVPFLRGLMLRYTAIVAAIALLLALVLGGGASFIVPRVFGDGFEGSIDCVRFMALGLLMPAVGWAHPICVAIGRPGWYLRAVLVMMTVKLAALAALTSTYGAVGAGAAYGIANLSILVVCVGMVPAIARRLRELPKVAGVAET